MEESQPSATVESKQESEAIQPVAATEETEVHGGIVKLWNVQKGFGFITPDAGGADVFVHQSDIEMEGFRCLCESEPVQYTLTMGEDGRSKASSVKGPGGGPLQGVWGGVQYSKGIVAAWSADRGFGFITPSDGGPDIFVHQSVIHANGFRSLGKSMSVEYTAEESDGKPKATKVTAPGGRPVQVNNRNQGGGRGGGRGGKGGRGAGPYTRGQGGYMGMPAGYIPQGFHPGMPQAMPQGMQPYMSQGLPQGLPQVGLPQGPMQGTWPPPGVYGGY